MLTMPCLAIQGIMGVVFRFHLAFNIFNHFSFQQAGLKVNVTKIIFAREEYFSNLAWMCSLPLLPFIDNVQVTSSQN